MTERIPMGNYPLWAARLIRWMLAKRLPKGTTILLRGRGPRTVNGRHYAQSIPLKYATRAGIYLLYPLRPDIVGYRYKEAAPVRSFVPSRPHPLDMAARDTTHEHDTHPPDVLVTTCRKCHPKYAEA